jgi:hypothetical protein
MLAQGFDENELAESVDYKLLRVEEQSLFHLWFANWGHSIVRTLGEVTRLEVIHHFRMASASTARHSCVGKSRPVC